MDAAERIRDYVQRAGRANSQIEAHMLAGELTGRIARFKPTPDQQVECLVALLERCRAEEWHGVMDAVLTPEARTLLWRNIDRWFKPELADLASYIRRLISGRSE